MTSEQEQALYQAEHLATQARALIQHHGLGNRDAWDGIQKVCHILARDIAEWEKTR